MPSAIWKIKAVEGHGWLRERFEGSPIITANRLEAEQFPTATEARTVLASLPSREGFMVVADAEHEPVEHGKPQTL